MSRSGKVAQVLVLTHFLHKRAEHTPYMFLIYTGNRLLICVSRGSFLLSLGWFFCGMIWDTYGCGHDNIIAGFCLHVRLETGRDEADEGGLCGEH